VGVHCALDGNFTIDGALRCAATLRTGTAGSRDESRCSANRKFDIEARVKINRRGQVKRCGTSYGETAEATDAGTAEARATPKLKKRGGISLPAFPDCKLTEVTGKPGSPYR